MARRLERISLNAKDFALLVAGGVVTTDKSAIMLHIIGWDRLNKIIANARVEAWNNEQEEWDKRNFKS